ncbi:MAG: 30S ribosomal protein S12 methylthiotransferase RimO [Actinomycetota bacterium]|nr:30S ribosomal protein S12 methylthiotransferase RimO [Actinomycetota bacterium]
MPPRPTPPRRVALVTLGCGRNEVDSEELAGRLAGDGWQLVDAAEAGAGDAIVVNTCGFIEAAKKDSIDTVLAAGQTGAAVVAVGCLAQRYGVQLAGAMPEVAAVLGFDAYPDIGARVDDVLAGRPVPAHEPVDRRRLLPLVPAQRPGADVGIPGHTGGPRVLRRRLDGGPVALLKMASGCDRRCSFCAIPFFRGSFVSRPPADLLAEAHWLAERGARELVLVSENSTSYGKDLGDIRLLERVLPDIAAVPAIVRVRVSYLQPAELRPGLVEVLASTPGVAPYFDLSFQHASEAVLRRMRRFGSPTRFLGLLESIRSLAPQAGARSNFILGFPGETKSDVAELAGFLADARLDAVGVFGYSDEDGTEAARLTGKVRRDAVSRRVEKITRLAEELTAQRAQERVGTTVEVLVEEVAGDSAEGRAAHQAPEVDGATTVHGPGLRVGDLVSATVVAATGVDLVAELVRVVDPMPAAGPS